MHVLILVIYLLLMPGERINVLESKDHRTSVPVLSLLSSVNLQSTSLASVFFYVSGINPLSYKPISVHCILIL